MLGHVLFVRVCTHILLCCACLCGVAWFSIKFCLPVFASKLSKPRLGKEGEGGKGRAREKGSENKQ